MSCPDCATAFDQGYRMGERDYSDMFEAAVAAMPERDRLRAALNEQGFLQKKADGSMVWHAHDCPASFDFAQCNYRCRVARAALEGKE